MKRDRRMFLADKKDVKVLIYQQDIFSQSRDRAVYSTVWDPAHVIQSFRSGQLSYKQICKRDSHPHPRNYVCLSNRQTPVCTTVLHRQEPHPEYVDK